mmetsp:Transcript_8168/g.12932  ORF Transcript_8168/g.12932 Transcript_8168/m.12932 type:complete len:531 (+) Transcript_8168:10-1602(+)
MLRAARFGNLHRLGNAVIRSRSFANSVSTSRGLERNNEALEIGETCNGFEVLQKFEVKDKKWICYNMRHKNTKAEYFHIDSPDLENTFGIIFKTLPDSSGVAHILEHTTLCGSRKYPVRDPFFNMMKRSINTYMNAWTGYDWTAYPFSSQNKKDFHNLLKVYLDATFFPNLNKFDFLQEGHRLELSDPSDISSPLCIKGVVYNEMKGASANPDRQISVKLNSELFPPHITYHHDSGGDPAQIPYLTYEKLQKFHQDNYQPSNTRFYSYGDLPVQDTLQYLDDAILSQFEASKVGPEVQLVDRFSTVKTVETTIAPYPGVPLEVGNTALVSYLTTDITNIEEGFYLEILSSLLLKGSSSPFYKARMERNGLGKDFSVGTGYADHTRETSFGFGIQGIREDEVKEVFSMVDDTLEKVANQGFTEERIESTLHTMELQKRRIASNSGLSVFGNVISPWVHGADLEKYLDLDSLIASFRQNLSENPKFLQEKLSKHLIENTHGVKLICRSDGEYTAKKENEEKKFTCLFDCSSD